MAEDSKIETTETGGKTRRAFVTKAAQVAATAPAASMLLASVKPAAAVSAYVATQNHILDDFTTGNNHEDIDALEWGSNTNPNTGLPQQDDHIGG